MQASIELRRTGPITGRLPVQPGHAGDPVSGDGHSVHREPRVPIPLLHCRHSRDSGNDAIRHGVCQLSLLTVIPAKAGIH